MSLLFWTLYGIVSVKRQDDCKRSFGINLCRLVLVFKLSFFFITVAKAFTLKHCGVLWECFWLSCVLTAESRHSNVFLFIYYDTPSSMCCRVQSTISRLPWHWLLLLSPKDCRPSLQHVLHLVLGEWLRRMQLFAVCHQSRHSAVLLSSAPTKPEH